MKLNGREITIQSYVSESIGDQLVIYNEIVKKVIIANDTAAFIWKTIVDMWQTGRDINTQDIAEIVCRDYNICDNTLPEICGDIEEMIHSFFEASLLTYITDTSIPKTEDSQIQVE